MREETNTLLGAMKQENAFKETENGATALNTTFSSLLDLFGEIGALRRRNEKDIIDLFMKAYAEDRLLALKMLFYARDIRGGLGERRTFRIILKHLAINHTEDVTDNIKLIPEYGRWDDLLVLLHTPAETSALNLIYTQLADDLNNLKKGQSVSLMAKWLPSENTSSSKTKELAQYIRKEFKLTPKQYRQALSFLRKKIDIVERSMSANRWSTINYEAVPSKASLNYREAFIKHDKDRYKEYISKVEKGEAKINSSTLYPYDLVKKYVEVASYDRMCPSIDSTIEAQWKALPDYVNNSEKNFLIMADVSGSMESPNYVPMSTSVGLAIYFAERSKGAFKNHFITFTNIPKLVEIPTGLPLAEKVSVVTNDVGFSTNLKAAFDLVLESAIEHKVLKEDMPTAIVVISDMEIDQFGVHGKNTAFTKEMSAKFNEAGYDMPTLVYWNVNARQNTFHATKDDNVRFVSGSSPSVFKGLCEHLGYTALDLMLETLNSPRYALVK